MVVTLAETEAKISAGKVSKEFKLVEEFLADVKR